MPETAVAAKPNIFPFIRYKDAPAAIDWLVAAFGFEKRMVMPGEGDTLSHAELSLGPGVIMVASLRDDEFRMKSPRDLGAVNQGLYVAIDDADAHYARAKAAGAEIVRPIESMDYGSREYSCRDIEGHLWSFGTYRPEN